MPARDWLSAPANRQRLLTVGIGVVGGAAALAGLTWLLQRTLEGGRVRVTLVHELEPQTRALLDRYQPYVAKLADQGLDHNVRLFRRRGEEGDLLEAMAPKGTANHLPIRYLY